ncbi:LuxR C-terminal-related transcriptional regulator [Streptomyces sp. NK15101]|uniref:helix-turn-helix transcriptional regulator n=1 Tax=Streptomyces sp. NK15101 TaxID=2873261 RepID=UPI001CED2D1B|nr:LuxR C-terminal-related transcriptional regulator [Streptomyces sp. NK15101]
MFPKRTTGILKSDVISDSGTEGRPPGSLDEDARRQVLLDILGVDVDRELIDFAAGVNGDPHLLAELALGLAEEGLVEERDGVARLTVRRIPRRVLAAVSRELGELSAACQQFLKVAAVLGRSFELEDVSRMLDRSSASLLAPLDEALLSGFVVETECRLAFQSDFLFRGVFESIPASARGALRREATGIPGPRIPGSEESFRAAERPTEARYEVEEGGGGGFSRAHGLIMGGDAAAGIHVAESILENPAISQAAQHDAEASVILGSFLLGQEKAVKLSEQILRERGTRSGDVAALMALATLSNVCWRAGELSEGLSLGRTAVRYGGDVDPVWRLHFQLALAGKLANLREFKEAELLIDEADAGLRGRFAPVWTAAPATMRARISLQSGRLGEALRQAEAATAASGREAVPMLRPLASSVLGTIALYLGDLPGAIGHVRQMHADLANGQAVLESAQYAWTEVLVTAKQDGPRAAAELLSERYGHLPTRRSLYIEDPSAAAFLIRLARDVGDEDLKHGVLDTVDGLMADNPDVSIVGLTAMHAHALADGDPAALAHIIVESPDPVSVAMATEELAKMYAAEAPARWRQSISPSSADGVSLQNASCWARLSEMERRISYLVSVGLTNRQIARRVHLSAHTVNYHLRKIYRKMGINTRVELARQAATYSSGAAVYSMESEEQDAI